MSNCTFLDNAYAGLMARPDRQSLVTHCTFTGNRVGITHFQEADVVVANCILWDNVLAAIQGPATVTYSNIEGGWEGEGNIDSNPLFADVQGRLSAGSPCIDAGTNDPPGGLMPIDLEGNPRPLDGNGDGYSCRGHGRLSSIRRSRCNRRTPDDCSQRLPTLSRV